jgi:hypothetical protein
MGTIDRIEKNGIITGIVAKLTQEDSNGRSKMHEMQEAGNG